MTESPYSTGVNPAECGRIGGETDGPESAGNALDPALTPDVAEAGMNDSNARPQAEELRPYGKAPDVVAEFDPTPRWDEFMHYLYLPVRIPNVGSAFPRRLWFLERAASICLQDAEATASHLSDPYVYITARRGFATPGNPLNRPGWHCDDFGGTDLNYVWSDRYPTRFLLGQVPPISSDDQISMRQFEDLAERLDGRHIVTYPSKRILRLDPFVIHDTPAIPAPGGMRSFFKISISTHRYNLLGNSHNHGLDYDWPMYDRVEVRNQPNGAADYVADRPPVSA